MEYDELISEIENLLRQYNGEISHSSYWNNEVIPTKFFNIDKEIMTELPLDYQINKMKEIKEKLKNNRGLKNRQLETIKESLSYVRKNFKVALEIEEYFKRIDKLELDYKNNLDKKKYTTIKSILARLRYELQNRAKIIDFYFDDLEEKISQLEKKSKKGINVIYQNLESKPLSIEDTTTNDYSLEIDNMIKEINQHFDFLTFSQTLILRLKEQKAKGENYIICNDIPESICRTFIDLPENKGLKFFKETGMIIFDNDSE